MPSIIIDGRTIQCREGIPVLRAALEAGMDIPHYCYHPGLSIVASCRLCLMEMKAPDPKTREPVWSPKLIPSCQTPVKDGMEVRFNSEGVQNNQQHVMEYYLLNHPLDCPVCDKAGECHLQDYTEDYGPATSRMVEEKHKNPKKDIGPNTLLYADRCVMCTRCVRFTREVSGDAQLAVVDRGNRAEIDVFPGEPLDNPLQGNVVDLCPVGALLDKGFLFKQRVWELRSRDSVCPGCARGCTTHIDYSEASGQIKRIRPRFNEKVNHWWMCDEGRFGWTHVHNRQRLSQPRLRDPGAERQLRWEELPALLTQRFGAAAKADRGTGTAVVLSPHLACEEAWLLAKFIRKIAPQATLVGGYLPVTGQDQKFPAGFVILSEKAPNRRGIERIITAAGGPQMRWDEFISAAGAGRFSAAYVTGGYPASWVSASAAAALARVGLLVMHDLFTSALTDAAAIVLPASTWAEREGCFVNVDGLVQAFERAIPPLEGVKTEGQFFAELAGESGLYRARKIREKMSAQLAEFGSPFVPAKEPAHAH